MLVLLVDTVVSHVLQSLLGLGQLVGLSAAAGGQTGTCYTYTPPSLPPPSGGSNHESFIAFCVDISVILHARHRVGRPEAEEVSKLAAQEERQSSAVLEPSL